jgi:hypothetical protein
MIISKLANGSTLLGLASSKDSTEKYNTLLSCWTDTRNAIE